MEKVDAKIREIAERVGFLGSVVVKQGEGVVYSEGFGYRNIAEKLPNQKDTKFGIASGSKLFTAVAIAQLVEQNQFAYDTPVHQLLEQRPHCIDERVTIHHLLTHTSGIPDYFDEAVMDDFSELWEEKPMYKMENLEDFLPMFVNKEKMFEPGERFHYNNAGFIVLGLVVEAVANQSYVTYVTENIFKAAGMQDAGHYRLDQLPGNTALGYIQKDGVIKTNVYDVPVVGGSDGGAFVTGPDMTVFWEALLGGKLMGADHVERLLTKHIKVKSSTSYGYGLWLDDVKEQTVYHVMGYDPGVQFHSCVYPEQQAIVTVLSNKGGGAFKIVQAVEELFQK
ncbi:serine hydrolase domain-containing protein [Halobacillus sp. HZG1]|uniref:serine hydrolase domain-containing protein n=1 Tax=Halobacillus sp. HZG1 TaxID=3111769 RepID=UPI002DBB4DD7|nr:serine hydrolase domain-containing protein [Halobacillus sp. HZG1]MEC3884769.1 serine hydrolase domain-containing protein [Halobacillus sp. HZG1]